jgi:hypothetical protein
VQFPIAHACDRTLHYGIELCLKVAQLLVCLVKRRKLPKLKRSNSELEMEFGKIFCVWKEKKDIPELYCQEY